MKNRFQIIILTLSFFLIVGALLAFYMQDDTNKGSVDDLNRGSITVWGTQPESRYAPVFSLYLQQQKVAITYEQKNATTLTTDLFAAIARGVGPDAVIASVDWISGNRDIIVPVPQEIMTPEELRSSYIDMVDDSLLYDGQIWGLPVAIDPLMLYWNKDIFNLVPLPSPPKTWEEVQKISPKLTKSPGGGAISQSAIALGRANNIPLARDIISLLLAQLGGTIEGENGELLFEASRNPRAGESALDFYTDFGRQTPPAEKDIYTWHSGLPEPRNLFVEGKLSMMLDYLSYAPILRARNPHLSFELAPVPQPNGSEVLVYYANLEAFALLKKTQQQPAVWRFGKALAGEGSASALLFNKTIDIPARRDVLTKKPFIDSPFVELYQKIALNARRPYDTHPERNKRFITQMIESIADGALTSSAAISDAKRRAEEESRQ